MIIRALQILKKFNKNIDLLGSDGKIENSLEMDRSKNYSIIYVDQDESKIFQAYKDVFSDFWFNENLDFSISFPGRIYYTYGKVTYEESNPQKAKVALGGGTFAVVYDYTSLHMVNIVLILTKILSVLNIILAIMSLVKEIKNYDDYDNVVGTVLCSILWIISGIWNFIILVELFSINKIIDLVISIILAIASILRIVIRHDD